MAQIPPPGYDDTSFIPYQHLIQATDHLENDLRMVKNLFNNKISRKIEWPKELDRDFIAIRKSAEELGHEHQIRVNKIWDKYNTFKMESNPENFNELTEEVKSFKKFLTE